MSSNIFVNNYKKQTDKLPDQPAYSIDVLSTTTPSANVPSGRLKGRARKEAKLKIAAEAAKAAEDTKTNTTYRIKLSQFTKLAGVIVHASGSSVPDSVLKLAKQIVDLPKGFSRFYEKEATDAVRKENFNHAHFITIIEEVINILTPSSLATVDESSKVPGLDQKNTRMRTSLQPNEKNDNPLSNRFNHLEVEEPVDIDEASPTSATTASTANAIDFKASNAKRKAGRQVKYQSDEDEEDDEKFFAMHCLFTDLHDLRTFIGKTWEDYSCGRLDLMISSILANTAFDLARRADENYFAMCPKAGSAQNLIKTSMDFLGLLCGVDPFHKHQPDDWFNYRLADGAQWVCLSTSILLVSFRKLIEPKQMSLVRPGFFGDYDAKSDRHAMSLRQKFAERTILWEALPEFCLFVAIRCLIAFYAILEACC
ncbi:hypothetical protein OEA41_009143 [Lepraria neglecta]|uniref:DUF6604 domain-containing protein n=1 Tax=Lepraria neglecta TaxID=209136 RepID=A0AAD9Z1E2_9LECA|nr:hypothetical protein OEA41_009143 [Lepraria neglecta]